MKRLIIFALAILPGMASSQTSFKIVGTIKNLSSGNKIYLHYKVNDSNLIDSAVVNDESFNFNGEIIEPVTGRIYLNTHPARVKAGVDFKSLYIDTSEMRLTGYKTLRSINITGSKLNVEADELDSLIQPISLEISSIRNHVNALNKDNKEYSNLKQDLIKRYEIAKDNKAVSCLRFAIEHPNSLVSISALELVLREDEMLTKVEKIYSQLSSDIRKTEMAIHLSNTILGMKRTSLGVKLEFEYLDLEGMPHQLSDLRGKFVLVDFWSTWCGPCIQEFPFLTNAYSKYKEKGFEILGIALDNSKSKVVRVIEKYKLNWLQSSDFKGFDGILPKTYGIFSVPTNFLIDEKGRIIGKNLRGSNLEKVLSKAFGNTN